MAFEECGLHNLTGNISLGLCKEYLKSGFNKTNLTIIDKIEMTKIPVINKGNNLFLKSTLGWSIYVKKGYVPVMRIDKDVNLQVSGDTISLYNDYFCLNRNTSLNKSSQIFNLNQINMMNGALAHRKLAVQLVFKNPDQTILTNYTLNHVYNLFGSFAVNVYTLFGGNFLSSSNKFINVQKIQTHPFKTILINQFDLNCTLNEFRLDCILRVNISNYANSFQQITIDYGDSISLDSFKINPYCKYKINFFFTFQIKLKI